MCRIFLATCLLLAASCTCKGSDEGKPPLEPTLAVTEDNVFIDPAVGSYSENEGILLNSSDGVFEMCFDIPTDVAATVEDAPWLTIAASELNGDVTRFRFAVKDAPRNGSAGYIVLKAQYMLWVAVTPPQDTEPAPEPAPDPNPDTYPFDLNYELSMELNTVGNGFLGYNNYNGAHYYPTRIEVFNACPAVWGDATAKTTSTAAYGFLTDAPASYNRLDVPAFGNEMFVFRGYEGKAGTQYNPGGISIVDARFSQVFFRQIRFTLPIPAGVLPTQKVVYKIVVDNITANAVHDAPRIAWELAELQR